MDGGVDVSFIIDSQFPRTHCKTANLRVATLVKQGTSHLDHKTETNRGQIKKGVTKYAIMQKMLHVCYSDSEVRL